MMNDTTASHPDSAAQQVHCPRCGYDQQGEIARWEVAEPAACPLVGRCTECGLELEWRRIFRPELEAPDWFVETLPPYRSVRAKYWAALRTAARSLAPWSFWKRIRMEYAVVLRRAVVVGMLVAFASYVVMAVSTVALDSNIATSLPDRLASLVLDPLSRPGWFPYAKYEAWSFYTPYSSMQWPDDINISAFLTLGDAAVWITGLLMPLAFVLLPMTLKRCRVRGVHLARIAIYTTPWCLLIAGPMLRLMSWVLILVAENVPTPGVNMYWWVGMVGERAPTVVLFVCGLWLFIAWGLACSRYLRLPAAWGVAASLFAICMMIAVLVMLVAWPLGFYELFSGLV